MYHHYLFLFLITLSHLAVSQNISKQALHYTNQFRTQHALPPCEWHQELADIATKHSKAMAEHKVPFGHANFKQRIATCTVHPRAAAENVYMTNKPGDLAWYAVDGWINSKGHRKNMLGNYAYCGIGIWQSVDGFFYVTQIFGLW